MKYLSPKCWEKTHLYSLIENLGMFSMRIQLINSVYNSKCMKCNILIKHAVSLSAVFYYIASVVPLIAFKIIVWWKTECQKCLNVKLFLADFRLLLLKTHNRRVGVSGKMQSQNCHNMCTMFFVILQRSYLFPLAGVLDCFSLIIKAYYWVLCSKWLLMAMHFVNGR